MIIRRRYSAITARRKGTHYFRLTAEEDDVTFTIDIGNLIGNGSFNNNYFQYIEYSTDEGRTWVKTIHPNRTTQTITISNIGLNNSVLLRGSAKSLSVNSGGQSSAYNTTIKADKNFSVKGVLMTLLIPDADKNTPITDGQAQFKHLFHPQNSTTGKCIDAGDLIMPSGVTNGCYYAMFSGNSQLRRAPKLPATTLATNCYRDMFVGCTALTYVNMQALDISASNCLTEWLPAATMLNLEFHRNPGATWWVVGKNGIPQQSVLFDDTEPLQEKETFIDPEVQRIVIANWGNRKPKNTSYSGGGQAHYEFKSGIRIGGVDGKVLKRQLANVRTILTEFKGSSIVDFSDLAEKFPNLYSLGAEWGGYYGGLSSCFQDCTSLKYITIPNTVKYLGAAYTYSNGCFQGSGIESIYIPDSVTASGDHLFYNCTKLKTVRWSSNLPTRVNTTDFYSNVFDSCSNLETIENYPTTIGSIVPAYNWKNCSKLDIFQFYPLLQGAVNIGTGSISGTKVTNLPQDLIFYNLVSCAGASPGNLAGVGRRRLFLPKVTTISQYGLANNSASLIDLGNVTGTYFFPGNGNSSTNTVTVILRSTAVPTFSTFNKTNVQRIYVYDSIIDDFKADSKCSTAASITFAIGGEEWATEFGSSYEYADYPVSQSLSINDTNDYSHQYTDYNSSLSMTTHFSGTSWRTVVFPTNKISGTNIQIAEITGVTITEADDELSSFSLTTSLISGESIVPGRPYLIKATDSQTTKTLTANPAPVFDSNTLPSIVIQDGEGKYQFTIKGTYEAKDDLVDSYVWNGSTWILNTNIDPMRAFITVTKLQQE